MAHEDGTRTGAVTKVSVDGSAATLESPLVPAPVPQHKSLPALLRWRARVSPNADAFMFRNASGDAWVSATWEQFASRVEMVAAGLISLGVEAGDCVALAASTSYDWITVDFAVLSAGAVTTTIYPTSSPADIEHILDDSRARVVIAEGAGQLRPILAMAPRAEQLRYVVSFSPAADVPEMLTLQGLIDAGRTALGERPDLVRERVDAIDSHAFASILYTSGTTGRPKGVGETHGAWLSTIEALERCELYDTDDVHLLWLPLAHAFGKLLSVCGVRCGFVTAVDGAVDRISENLKEVRPTFMCSVPRVLEKVYAKAHLEAASSPVKERLVEWAVATGRNAVTHPRSGVLAGVRHRAADKLVLAKIRAVFGGRMRFFISGSAPLDPEIARWFSSVGIPVLEGYGLTESGAASTITRIGANRWGSVGQPIPGTQARIASDGEVLLRGPGLMQHYHKNEEATRETLSEDGWLHTGDIGKLDPDGTLYITDRKKNVFKTANGKYVAPSSIEARFMAVCPLAAQFVVIGESRRFVTALVVLDQSGLFAWAKEQGVDYRDFADLTRNERVRELVQGYVEELNASLNPWEQVKKFIISDRELTIEAGDLTPSMKLRRKVVESKFAEAIEEQYAGPSRR